MKFMEAVRVAGHGVIEAGHAVERRVLDVWEGVLVGVALSLWICTFAVGILVASGPYREAIRAGEYSVEAGVMVLISYTVPNLLLLCVLSSLLGALGNRARLGHEDERTLRNHASPYIAAAIRGFFVYLAFLAGVLILDEQIFLEPSQGTYIRTGAVMSLVSFVVSYNPRTFGALLARVARRFQSEPSGSKAAPPPGT